MSNHVMIVMTNPVDGKKDEYNEWYSDIHVHEVVDIPGFVSAQRFKLVDAQRVGGKPFKYLAIYEVEGDPGAALEALKAARPNLNMSDAIDLQVISNSMFTPITDKVTAGMKA